MKKIISKSPKTPAPAPVKPAPTSTQLAAAKLPRAKTPKATTAVKGQAPVVIAPKPDTVVATTIIAQIDIGFGNILYIRGNGAGLSWDQGLVMENATADQWKITLGKTTQPVTFKFLVNDLTWSAGEDYVVEPGSTVTLVPTF
ncbi:MAG TPA: hypothetical protein VMC06_10180 [Opitutaceae bacterium]|nr:hypothetical protein [Opitutaceae bacterium]